EWQRQLHLFIHPFYYIEYGIAQLGALGLWLHSLEHGPAPALALYKKALTLGGSRPLPELFATAGLPFDFSEKTIARITAAVTRDPAKRPARKPSGGAPRPGRPPRIVPPSPPPIPRAGRTSAASRTNSPTSSPTTTSRSSRAPSRRRSLPAISSARSPRTRRR